MPSIELVASVIKILFLVTLVMGVVPIVIWLERRGAGWIQGRPGPNRVGPFGLMQPLADVFKLVFKESFVPKNASKFYYYLAPIMAAVAPLAAWAAIPFGSYFVINGIHIHLILANVPLGVLAVLAFAGLEIYPVMLAGWASNNKYSSFGALRGASQFVSYEISMGLALASMLLIYGTFDLTEMANFQAEKSFLGIPMWGILLNPVAFIIFLISIFAETNRVPFDLPEADAELVGGYHTEYGSTKFAMFFFAEYIAMMMASGLLIAIFFGGFNLFPGMGRIIPCIADIFGPSATVNQNILAAMQIVSFFIKVGFMMFFFIWVRWSFPRFRFDQLMNLGWKILLPLSLLNLIVVAIVLYLKGN